MNQTLASSGKYRDLIWSEFEKKNIQDVFKFARKTDLNVELHYDHCFVEKFSKQFNIIYFVIKNV